MHKLITLSDKQYAHIKALMDTTRHDSFSEFIRYLVLFYEDNQKRPAGRPRLAEQDGVSAPPENDEDDVEKYKVPDKHTTSMYSYNDLRSWYDAHPEAGAMPARQDLVIHARYKGTR